jgi:purine-binding chemotaxis protein CheW
VTFTVDDRAYGVDIMAVREIRQWSKTTELPNQARHGRGVIDIRGEVVPVHDLRARFGGPLTEVSSSHAILIVSVDQKSLGILVDSVSDIVFVAADQIRPVPTAARASDHENITGLARLDGKMIALLNIDALFGRRREEAESEPEADALAEA